jgi:hypothetical protein
MDSSAFPNLDAAKAAAREENPLDERPLEPPEPWVWRDPTSIPPRPWLLGTTLMCGYATLIGGIGGAGKLSMALAIITGRSDITGEHVFQTGKVWFITLEDNRLELERRIAAAMIAHKVRREDVEGRLFINDRSGRRPLVLIKTDVSGNPEITVEGERVANHIRDYDILLTIIDPLVKAHKGIENRNEHMDALGGVTNDIAANTGTAVALAAHFRKNSSDDGSRDAFRGGGALLDAMRIARALTPMSEADGKAFNLTTTQITNIVREQNPKANMAPRQAAVWFELVSVPLGNTQVDPRYPAGDHVQALKPWRPSGPFEGMDHGVLVRIFERLRGEPEEGWFYSINSRAKFWGGKVLMEEAGKSHEQALAILKAWEKDGVITTTSYETPPRNDGIRIVLNETKIAEIRDPLRPVKEQS